MSKNQSNEPSPTRTIAIELPVGRPAYITLDKVRYDSKGNWLGREVVFVQETFSRKEAEIIRQHFGCPECGGVGEHKSYFVCTGQNPGGNVEGYTRKCGRS